MQLLQVTDVGLAYIVVGGFVVAFSMVSLLIKQRLYINEVVLGTACGVIFGPFGANIFNPRAWGGDLNTITLEVMRITLAAGLFTIGVELPRAYLAQHAKGLLVMVVPTMAFGWISVAVVIMLLFPKLSFVSSLAIAACLTPTDPIISAAIVGGRWAVDHVPQSLRYIISAESAANDGMAYPFLSISIFLTVEKSAATVFGKWVLIGCLYQVVLGTIIGVVLGQGFSRIMKLSHRKGFIDRESYIAQYLALTIFTIGVTRTLGSDDLLAAFAAGSALNWDGYFNKQIDDEVFSSVIDLVLNCGTFVYIGAWIPFTQFNTPDLGIEPWRLFVLFIVVMLIRRIPPLLALFKWVPEIATWKEALFAGHFGPMGVGAIFVSTLAITELPTPHSPPQSQAELLAAILQTIVSFVVLGSIVVHGLSIPFFSFSRSVGARTLTLTRTMTSRYAPTTPEWLNNVRRMSVDTARPQSSEDVEHGKADVSVEEVHVPEVGEPENIVVHQSENVGAARSRVRSLPDLPYLPKEDPRRSVREELSEKAVVKDLWRPSPKSTPPSPQQQQQQRFSASSVIPSARSLAQNIRASPRTIDSDIRERDITHASLRTRTSSSAKTSLSQPIDIAAGNDLTEFLARLRQRGPQTPTSPSIRGAHSPEDGSSVGDEYE